MKAEAVPAAPPSKWHACAWCPDHFDTRGLPTHPAVIKVRSWNRWVWLCWSHSVMALGEPRAIELVPAQAVAA